jgi:hypothetical protein
MQLQQRLQLGPSASSKFNSKCSRATTSILPSCRMPMRQVPVQGPTSCSEHPTLQDFFWLHMFWDTLFTKLHDAL